MAKRTCFSTYNDKKTFFVIKLAVEKVPANRNGGRILNDSDRTTTNNIYERKSFVNFASNSQIFLFTNTVCHWSLSLGNNG